MAEARQELTPLTAVAERKQGYCQHGDVGEVLHKNAWECADYALQQMGNAAVKSSNTLSNLYIQYLYTTTLSSSDSITINTTYNISVV
jgi:hypothetical protein